MVGTKNHLSFEEEIDSYIVNFFSLMGIIVLFSHIFSFSFSYSLIRKIRFHYESQTLYWGGGVILANLLLNLNLDLF